MKKNNYKKIAKDVISLENSSFEKIKKFYQWFIC